jgi:predicted MFS family arabinose efflux permease
VFVLTCMLLFAVLLFVFGQASTVQQFYLIAPFLGAAAYGYTPLLIAHMTELSGQERAGSAAGLTNVVWQIGSALAPIAVGYVYASTGSFLYSLVTLAIGPLLGAATMVFVAASRPAPGSEETAR